jgi:hypothetical protein
VNNTEKLTALCPRHSKQGKRAKVGFRCICRELDEAYLVGLKAGRKSEARYYEEVLGD